MEAFIVSCWEALMDSENNPLLHRGLGSQHDLMQVPGWMWSMVFSLGFLSIHVFGITSGDHLLLFGGAAMTVAMFKESEKQEVAHTRHPEFTAASGYV